MTIKRGRNHKSTRPAAPPAIKDTATLMKKAQDCIDKLDPQGALIFLREALALEPENIQVIDLTASTMMDAGDDENAFPVRYVFRRLSSYPNVVACKECADGPKAQLRKVDVFGPTPSAILFAVSLLERKRRRHVLPQGHPDSGDGAKRNARGR